jgi:hypothetical protein
MFLFVNTFEAASSHLLGSRITPKSHFVWFYVHWGPFNEIMNNVVKRLKGLN